LPRLLSSHDFKMDDDHVLRELQIAFDQADRGEWRDFDVEALIAEARRRDDSAHATMPE
jgi:hypothetical protein